MLRHLALRRRPGRAAAPDEMDMTPMIDVTFQLIVFFLVANDLSRREIVDLALPRALHSTEVCRAGDVRVTVNLRPASRPGDPPSVVVGGRALDRATLARHLRAVADRARPGGPGTASEARALVRADESVPWRHVQEVLQACAAPGVAIHRVEFAARRPSSDGPAGGR